MCSLLKSHPERLQKSPLLYDVICGVLLLQSILPHDGNATMTSSLKMESKGTQIHLPLIGRGSKGEISDKVMFSVKSPPDQLNNGQPLA